MTSFFKRVAPVFLAVAAVVVIPAARPAHAAETISAVNGLFTGTSGNDEIIFSSDGMLMKHNLTTLGFANEYDFDSTAEGVQSVFAGQPGGVTLNMLGGDDHVYFDGEIENGVLGAFDMGEGFDTLNFWGFHTHANAGVTLYGDANRKMQTVERVYGSQFADTINANTVGRAVGITYEGRAGDDYVIGTTLNDNINAGTGVARIISGKGDDVVSVYAPLPSTLSQVDLGAGTDTVWVYGTGDDDALEIIRNPHVNAVDVFTEGDFQGGYRFLNTERANADLQQGDDFLFLSSNADVSRVKGGAGNDEIVFDALQQTATIGGNPQTGWKFTLPNGGKPAVINTQAVESWFAANETYIAVAAGVGGGSYVRTFDAAANPLATFSAYGANFPYSVSVAMGDVNGDYDDDIVTAAGPGGGPHVRVFYSDGTDSGVSFFAYSAGFTGGVNVATADFNGDGIDEIITVPATNAPPLVRIWDGEGHLLKQFLASGFDNNGLLVAGAPADAAPGPDQILLQSVNGGGLKTFEADGTIATQKRYRQSVRVRPKGSEPYVFVGETVMLPYKTTFRGGVSAAACNPEGGSNSIVTVPASGAAALVKLLDGAGAVKRSFLAFPQTFTGGASIACGGALSRAYWPA